MFDAIWTAALALNKTESQLRKRNLSLKNFTYKDEYGISDIIYEEALKLKFFGLSVSISMNLCRCIYICTDEVMGILHKFKKFICGRHVTR